MPSGVYIRTEENRKNIGLAKIGQVPWNKGKPFMQKENHPLWKGGRKYNDKGYVFVYAPNHPYKVEGRYIREHRLVMEQYLGRYLKPQEVVHHINGIKDDNRQENLLLFPNHSKHLKFCKRN